MSGKAKALEHALGIDKTDHKANGEELAQREKTAIGWLKLNLKKRGLRPVRGTMKTVQRKVDLNVPLFPPRWCVFAHCFAVPIRKRRNLVTV